ncbi:uncharacterized protein PHACADRAFT_265709, partial [Phanerochaete carnosa HHB-10118-sp]
SCLGRYSAYERRHALYAPLPVSESQKSVQKGWPSLKERHRFSLGAEQNYHQNDTALAS